MLEGSLDTFTLPDIFQLLSFTRKGGCLQLSRDDDRGRVWFEEGEVHYAEATTGRLALGKRLVGAGLLSTEDLQRALAEQQERRRGVRIGQLLVEQGSIDEATLHTFVREQIQDAVFDLMRWTSGTFAFDATVSTDETVGLAVSVENLIMEGSRRLEEWASVQRKIPGTEAVVAIAPAPGEGSVEVNLASDEWRLLSLVDGRRTVGELVELMGRGEFVTCKLLYGMVGAGLLEVRDPQLDGPPSVAALLEQVDLIRQLDDAARGAGGSATPAAPPAVDQDAEGTGGEAREGASRDEGTSHATEPVTVGVSPRRLATDPAIDVTVIDRMIDGLKALS